MKISVVEYLIAHQDVPMALVDHPDGRGIISGCYSEVAAELISWAVANDPERRPRPSVIYAVAARVEERKRRAEGIRAPWTGPEVIRPPKLGPPPSGGTDRK